MEDQVKVDRSARSASGRKSEDRRRPWAPPSRLDAPAAPPGFKHRWIRAEAGGQEDRSNVAGKIREGYELVRGEEHPEYVVPTAEDGRHAGVIKVGGLLLARIPEETVAERNAYYQGRTQDQLEALDNDLMKANAHSTMVINRPDRSSRTTFGGPKADT